MIYLDSEDNELTLKNYKMLDFAKLEEGQTILFDFEGKTYERKVEKDNEGCLYISLGRKEYFPNANLALRLGNYVIWLNSEWSEIVEDYNVRFKPEYNFHAGQKVSYVVNGEKCVGIVEESAYFLGDLNICYNKVDGGYIWLYHNKFEKWDKTDIEKYQVKPITENMETPIDFDQQIINAKLEFADKMLFNGNETSLAALQVNQTLKKILSIEKQRKLYNAEQLWKRLRDQVVSDEDENGDKKFYDMIQDLELYYETKLKPITNTPKEFTSNDGC